MGKLKTLIDLMRKSDKRELKVAFMQNLSGMKISHIIPDKKYLNMWHKAMYGKKINFKNPKTFTEKLQWLKLYNRNLEDVKLVDKYEAKKYIADRIGEEYIIPNIGVWDSVDEIDLNSLPDRFVLKCTHDSGSVVICRDKSKFDFEAAKAKLDRKMKKSLFWLMREWHYKKLKPRIIAEQYMENTDMNLKELRDYKFYCFNGEAKYLYVSEGLENHATAKISFLNLDWSFADFGRSDFAPFTELPEKPKAYEKMLELANQLSKGHAFLRVDLYEINGKIYFSELTFFPAGGFMPFDTLESDCKLGELIEL